MGILKNKQNGILDNTANLPEILEAAHRDFPCRTAVVFGQKKMSYAELREKSARVAKLLKDAGIKKGGRVALLLDNSPDFIVCYFGILMAGGIVVPVNHMFKRDEVRYILEDSQSSCLITSSAYAAMAQELNCMVDTLSRVIFTNQKTDSFPSLAEYLSGGDAARETAKQGEATAAPGRDDLAVFLYTSGTTGHPKAAQLTHGNLLSNAASASRAIRVSGRDTLICFLPLFHSFAATVCMLMPLACGAKTVILKSARPVKKLLRAIRNNRVTIFVGIPSIYQILGDMKQPVFWRRLLMRIFNPVRLAISGAAALPVQVLAKFESRYGIPLLEGYGLTEASPVVSLNPLNGRRKPGTIGLPLPDVQVKIVDDQGRELGVGETGELCVQGPNVMRGYFGKNDENQSTLKDGWLLTGDMAAIDQDGYLTIMGRKKDMVNVRGLNVYPKEIEDVLYQNPNVREAAVIGIPDPHKGEVPKGFVVLKNREAVTERDLLAYLKDRLAPYKIPRRIEIRGDLPKNSAGKILKRVLAEECMNAMPQQLKKGGTTT